MSTPALQTLLPEIEAPDRPPVVHSNGDAPTRVVDAQADTEKSFLARLDRMTPSQRVEAYREGSFSRHERAVWACRYPEEVPLVNDEFEWLVLGSADLD